MNNLNKPRNQKRMNWIWGAIIALLAVALFLVMSNPSGENNAQLEQAQTGDVDVMVPADIPDTLVEEMDAPGDDAIVTRIEDETAAEAATSAN